MAAHANVGTTLRARRKYEMIMPEQINELYLAPCGVNCFVCYVHLKKKKPCNGCYGDNENKPERCKNCRIKNCVISKSIKYCFECNDFPCVLIKNLDKSYRKRYSVELIKSAGFIKENGIEKYMKNERNKWLCMDCGGIKTQHGNYCSECTSK